MSTCGGFPAARRDPAPIMSGPLHRKVLIVDDEQIMRDLLNIHLTHHGYDVLLAEDAVAAGYLVVREKPDVIICDVEMPYMNGYEFVAVAVAQPVETRLARVQ